MTWVFDTHPQVTCIYYVSSRFFVKHMAKQQKCPNLEYFSSNNNLIFFYCNIQSISGIVTIYYK